MKADIKVGRLSGILADLRLHLKGPSSFSTLVPTYVSFTGASAILLMLEPDRCRPYRGTVEGAERDHEGEKALLLL